MNARVASHGVPGALRALATLASAALVLLAFGTACGDDKIERVREEYAIVGGEPRVDPSRPTVDRVDSTAGPHDFDSNTAIQVDVFRQTQVAKTDILWVIDNSGSMKLKQDKVKANFREFVRKLVETDEEIDYHIGVVTTDTVDLTQAGRLQNAAGLSRPWVGRDTCQGSCDPVVSFNKNASVGIQGSGDEKGLLAAMLALSPPLIDGYNAGFLRDDAALFVIIVSDEEDSSCTPIDPRPHGGGCVPDEMLLYGSSDYYARFFQGLKGYGRGDHVAVGAIVALDDRESVGSGASAALRGCKSVDNSDDVAIYAPRYIEVAERTGGLATSICERDYVPALQNLGFLATGAKSSFLLSRAPYQNSIRVLVSTPSENTDAAPTKTLQVRGVDYDYEPCAGSGGGVLNAIRFRPTSLPPAGSLIEIEYPVDVRGLSCQ